MAPSIKNEKFSDMEPLNASEEEAGMPVNDSEDSSSLQSSDEMETMENQVTNEGSNNVPKAEKRERKKVINFVAESPVTVSKKLDLEQGSGVPLDDSPYINHMISGMKSEDLKFFHKILFLRPGSGLEIKKNIRKFKGYDFSKDSEKYKDLLKRIERLKSKSMLASALGIVGLHVSGTKEELAERLASFLVSPSPSLVTRTVPVKKSRKKRSSKKRSKKGTTKTPKSKKAASKKEVSKQESSEKESDSESDSDATKPAKRKRQEQESSDNEDSEPEVKKKTRVKKRKVLAKEKGDSNEETGRNKKSKKASLSKKKQDDKELSDDNSDDEHLIKKVKPSDDDIESFIKRYMKSANLEEVTMKNIYQRVNDEFPTLDVASKKDFIKSSVKQILTR